jgi:hypothetical protein
MPQSLKKLEVSFVGQLAEDVQHAAEVQANGNVTAWVADAARARLRQLALVEAVAHYEAEHGAFTEAELAEADRAWPPG